MTVNSHTVANTVVILFRFFSAAADPRPAPPPPNMSERPPPWPLWSKTPTMRANIDTTLMTSERYKITVRTVIEATP